MDAAHDEGKPTCFTSFHSTYNRLHLTQASYTTMETPSNFVMLLRKQLDGGFIRRIEQVGLDRVLRIDVEARDELGDLHMRTLYAELMGKYANLVLVNAEGIIVDAKRIPVFGSGQRLIHPGARYALPAQDMRKHDPSRSTHPRSMTAAPWARSSSASLRCWGGEVEYRMRRGEAFADIMEQIRSSHVLYLHTVKEQTLFHCIPLTHLQSEAQTYPLMEGMDALFYEKEQKVRVKQQSGDLFRVIRRELSKNRNKLPKLYQALDEAMDCDRYREYGDLLFAYQSSLKREPIVHLPSFEREEEVAIPIDMRFDIARNANRYHQKYHKQRRAQGILQEQIALCEQTIAYFEQLESQVELAAVPDAMEIREELVKRGYMNAQKSGIRRRKGKQIPHFTVFDIEGTLVYLGKNNIQNEYLTRTLARKDDLWFHTKDLHGSHVICTDPQPDERLLRICAMLAAYYSQGRFFQQRAGQLLPGTPAEEGARLRAGCGDHAALPHHLHGPFAERGHRDHPSVSEENMKAPVPELFCTGTKKAVDCTAFTSSQHPEQLPLSHPPPQLEHPPCCAAICCS